MLVRIEFTMTTPSSEVIDLKDYGYDVTTKWEDLTYEEQCMVTDSVSLEYQVLAGGEDLNYIDNESDYSDYYNDEDLEEIENSLDIK